MMMKDYARMEQAIHFLASHLEEQPGLGEVARHLGLSEHHFHRLFRRWVGVTPKDFVQQLTLVRARKLLARDATVLEASLAVGLSGGGRLHDLFTGLEAMTPGEFKRGAEGLPLCWGLHGTPLGMALIAVTDRGVCGFSFVEPGSEAEAIANLHARWPGATLIERPAATRSVADEVSRRMRGDFGQPLSLVLKGTPFQLKVWEALLSIPEGQVMTYQGLAGAAGAPTASRAVGTAMGANPVGYLIPCHRVIRSTGAIGEYRWGASRKQLLLALEAARRFGQGTAAEA